MIDVNAKPTAHLICIDSTSLGLWVLTQPKAAKMEINGITGATYLATPLDHPNSSNVVSTRQMKSPNEIRMRAEVR